MTVPTAKKKQEVVLGVCCKCGYAKPKETACPKGDGTHCNHWWDGPNAEQKDAEDLARDLRRKP